MKRTITITFDVDPSMFGHAADECDVGDCIDIVQDMLNGGEEFPDTVKITCEGLDRTVDVL